ncbi:acyl-CoA dehydrogenase family protein [Spirillospora sp. CA-142024]|uniref:acyl-CoA dehydrogenase family protein n=1 Tax=Spirillospora sp. CA-142024 TaxID=3240036 RepID=UPI003D8ABECF
MSVFETDDHRSFRQDVRDFAASEVAPHVSQMETSRKVDSQVSGWIVAQGWLGLTIPRKYGGIGAGHLAKTIAIEEIARVSAAMGAMLQASQLGAAMIIHYGTEEQKQTWLPQIATGECLPTIAVTEHESGGHVLGMQTTARRVGDHYVLDGSKVYVGNSHIGHVHGVVARTCDADTRPSKSLSAFLVRADLPGVRLVPYQRALGLHGFSFGDIVFDNVAVPASDRLGDEGDGLDVAYSSSVLYGRPNLTAVALGILQATADATVSFTKKRHRYGEPLAHHPVIGQRIGRLEHQLRTARTLAYQAAHMLDHGQACDNELINAKYYTVETALDATRDAVRIHGGAGLRTDRPLQRFYRDAIHIDAPAGTAEIQLHRLAETALGVDRGQWSERFAHLTALPPPATAKENAA